MMPFVELHQPGYSIDSVLLPPENNFVVMSYDDGPDPGGTISILDALEDLDAHATFFVLISRARRAPSLLREIVARGHELALHGQDHGRLSLLPPDIISSSLVEAKSRLEEMGGQHIQWFRPPYGDQTLHSWRATVKADLVPVMWTVEALDWVDVPQEKRVTAASSIRKPGGIILCHDSFPDAIDGVRDREPPPAFDRGELARTILFNYRERGLVATTLGDAMARGRPKGRAWLSRDRDPVVPS
jgi:peptidoglycan/xylan/chitin deacetylase (PgdA/CDA1 family)